MESLHLLPSIYDGDDFEGYDKVRLNFEKLEAIIRINHIELLYSLKHTVIKV